MSKSKKDDLTVIKIEAEEIAKQYEAYRKAYESHVIEHANYFLYGENWKEILKTKKALEEFDKDLKELLDE